MVSEKMLDAGRVRSAIRELFEFGRKRAKEVGEEHVYDFSLGNPSVPPPTRMTQEMLRMISECEPASLHGYTSAPGSDEARDAIAANLNRRFGTSFTRRNLYVSCGAAAALTSVLRALTLGPESEPDMIRGTDFVFLDGGRIKAVAGFLDKVPA